LDQQQSSSGRFHRFDKTPLNGGTQTSSSAAGAGATSFHNRNTLDPLGAMRRLNQGDNPHQLALEQERERRERRFPVLLSNVDKATAALHEVDRELRLVDEAKFNKTRRQFDEWNTQVHGEIMKKIHANIETVPSKALNKKKNDDYDKFLNITNRKPCIFRDIIIESECTLRILHRRFPTIDYLYLFITRLDILVLTLSLL
jgi:hypothetical protein